MKIFRSSYSMLKVIGILTWFAMLPACSGFPGIELFEDQSEIVPDHRTEGEFADITIVLLPTQTGTISGMVSVEREFTSTNSTSVIGLPSGTVSPAIPTVSITAIPGTGTVQVTNTEIATNNGNPYPGPGQNPPPTQISATSTPGVSATPTGIPEPSSTPVEVPPWEETEYIATNPETVDLSDGEPKLITFFAYWSGTSQSMAPLLHSLEEDYGDQIQFIYLDRDDPDTEELHDLLDYEFVPHIFVIDSVGDIYTEWQGTVSIDVLVQAIECVTRK